MKIRAIDPITKARKYEDTKKTRFVFPAFVIERV
jgi:hypothetical protein